VTKHYEQRKAANEEYLKKLDRITFRVSKGGKEELQSFIKKIGYPSVNQFVVDSVEYYARAIVSGEVSSDCVDVKR